MSLEVDMSADEDKKKIVFWTKEWPQTVGKINKHVKWAIKHLRDRFEKHLSSSRVEDIESFRYQPKEMSLIDSWLIDAMKDLQRRKIGEPLECLLAAFDTINLKPGSDHFVADQFFTFRLYSSYSLIGVFRGRWKIPLDGDEMVEDRLRLELECRGLVRTKFAPPPKEDY